MLRLFGKELKIVTSKLNKLFTVKMGRIYPKRAVNHQSISDTERKGTHTVTVVGCIGVSCHFNSYGHIMGVSDAHVFPGFLTPVLTQLFFPKPPTTFLICFSRGERRNYAGEKVCLDRESNSQPPCHKSNMLTTEPH